MNIRVFRYCLAVAEHRHFRRAAEACDASQSTLSTQISRLEDYLNVKIFERKPRSIGITEAGNEVLQHARTIVEAADALRIISKQASSIAD